MHRNKTFKHLMKASFVTAMAMLLTGCLMTPGHFTSQLDLRKSGMFSYTYKGEIHLFALSKLAEMGDKGKDPGEEFTAQPCYRDDDFEERSCSQEEIAEQERDWTSKSKSKAKSRSDDSEMMRQMLGGIDPAAPDAAAGLVDRLRRQKGWNAVEHKGDGMFLVDFSIEGRLDHDFLFPTIERFPMSQFFIFVANRDNDVVRVDAPGFSAKAGGNPFQEMMAGMAGMGGAQKNSDGEKSGGTDAPPIVPELDGTFWIITDGEILANNTDEGPVTSPYGQTLEWKINKRTQSAPMALIDLSE